MLPSNRAALALLCLGILVGSQLGRAEDRDEAVKLLQDEWEEYDQWLVEQFQDVSSREMARENNLYKLGLYRDGEIKSRGASLVIDVVKKLSQSFQPNFECDKSILEAISLVNESRGELVSMDFPETRFDEVLMMLLPQAATQCRRLSMEIFVDAVAKIDNEDLKRIETVVEQMKGDSKDAAFNLLILPRSVGYGSVMVDFFEKVLTQRYRNQVEVKTNERIEVPSVVKPTYERLFKKPCRQLSESTKPVLSLTGSVANFINFKESAYLEKSTADFKQALMMWHFCQHVEALPRQNHWESHLFEVLTGLEDLTLYP